MHNTNLFAQYAPAIRSLNLKAVTQAAAIPKQFLLAESGKLASYYTPFDRVNPSAKVVLVGITPGFTQWRNGMMEAQRQLLAGSTIEAAHAAAKQTGAFSGKLRLNLVRLLDRVGTHRWLKIDGCARLFEQHFSLVQTTSVLSHSIFVQGDDYRGTPSMTRTAFLVRQLEYFRQEVTLMHDPVYIPLGPKASEGLAFLAAEGVVKAERVLHGLPHPSGQNAERVKYFLGDKAKEALSPKTNAEKLDLVRSTLTACLLKLSA